MRAISVDVPEYKSCVRDLREHDEGAATHGNGTEPTRDITGDRQE